MTMHFSDARRDYLWRISEPQAIYAIALIGMYALVSVSRAVQGPSLLGTLIFAGVGFCASIADRRTLGTVPTFFTHPDTGRIIAITAGIAMAFLAILTHLSPGRAFVAMLILKAILPAGFYFLAFEDFRQNIYPIIIQYHDNPEQCDREIAELVRAMREERVQTVGQGHSIYKARTLILNFYQAHKKILQHEINDSQLYSLLRAEIPDTATDQEAYAAATRIMERLQGALGQQREQAKSQQERIAAIDREMADIRKELGTLRTNPILKDEPATVKAEVAAIERRMRELTQQKLDVLAQRDR